ncbi:hypothetical protein [Pontibacter sp. G13]|uniref:hypothetical protein n=1 Tax=Pontibacter sp. G13 TaxID=3074898 RepID=UPI00288AE5E0|nr:hypothetical protein [Pontibacter sp. G13]WNJ18027.1 hypothetical protein RJD25_24490 [Pontibacter sp. G13]
MHAWTQMGKGFSLLLCLTLVAQLSFAQNQRRKIDPEEMALRNTSGIQEAANLDDEQTKAVYAIELKYAEHLKEKSEAIMADDSNQDRMSKMLAMKTVRDQVQTDKTAEMKELLPKKQFKKYKKWLNAQEEARAERMGPGGRPGGGRGRPGGGMGRPGGMGGMGGGMGGF